MIIRGKADIQKAIDMLNTGLYWTFDIETTGLNVRSDKIIGFGCANPDTLQAFYIIMKEWNGSELEYVLSNSDVLPVIRLLQKRKLITWNGSFDTRFVYNYFNVNLIDSIYHDGMLAAHTLNENENQYGLKYLASIYMGADSTEAQAAMKQSISDNGGTDKEYYKADSTLMATYGIQDNILTAKFFNRQKKQLAEQGLTKFFYEHEVMPLYTHVTIPMELKGIPVDVHFMKQTLSEITADMDKLHTEIQEAIKPHLTEFYSWYVNKEFPVKLSGQFLQTLAEVSLSLSNITDWPRTKSGTYSFGEASFKKKQHLLETDLYKYYSGALRIPSDIIREVQMRMLNASDTKYPFNILSKDHLKRLFFEKLGETPLSFTDLGNPQVSDDLLDVLANKYDWVAKLRIYNKLVKIKSTYVERFLEKQENGIFYPSYFMHRTTSGRFSGDLQQLPRVREEDEDVEPIVRKYNDRIRSFFISGKGKKFVDADYSSLEVVVFADDAQDEALMNVIKNKYDLYSQVAINVNNLKEYSADKKAPNFLKKHRPELRQQAKAFALGFRYGLSAYKLSKDLNIPENEAKRLQREYFESYPKLKKRMDEIILSAKKTGKVVSKGGRIRRLHGLSENFKKYGEVIFDSLELWKEYGDSPSQYSRMKQISKECKAAVNNSLNFPIQSFAATIVSRASIEIMKEFRKLNMKAYICMSTHDELNILCPDYEVEQVKQIMQHYMENTTKLSVPLEAEPIVGEVYSEVK